jgi:hypothetical protein
MFSCGLCFLAVGGGLLIARKLGLNDYIVAVWISGLNTSLAFWLATLRVAKAKKTETMPSHPKGGLLKQFFIASLFYLGVYMYFSWSKQMNRQVFIGLTVGMESIFVAHFIGRLIRFKNKGNYLFPFQKVVIPIVFLLLASLVAAVKTF